MTKRCWKVLLPGRVPFVMIVMTDDEDPLSVVQSIWGDKARVE